MTEAGREYQCGIKTQAYNRYCKELNKLSVRILTEDGMEIADDISQELLDKWMLCHQEFLQIEQELQELLDPEDRLQHDKKHGQQLEEMKVILGLLRQQDPSYCRRIRQHIYQPAH